MDKLKSRRGKQLPKANVKLLADGWARGLTVKQIAEETGVNHHSVREYIYYTPESAVPFFEEAQERRIAEVEKKLKSLEPKAIQVLEDSMDPGTRVSDINIKGAVQTLDRIRGRAAQVVEHKTKYDEVRDKEKLIDFARHIVDRDNRARDAESSQDEADGGEG